MESILFFEPVLKETIWGGRKLLDEFQYVSDCTKVGECWGISAHPNGESIVKGGGFDGMTLRNLYAEHRELFGEIDLERFPLLVKIIDAQDKLSIQVHPDDQYAFEHENGSLGKYECWYILDCPENARLVIGHKAQSREELSSLIHEDRYDELIDYVEIHKGDFLQIQPGTMHAITEGVMLLEVQQSSDVTYRVFDYHRLMDGKPRPLHVEQCIEVLKVPDPASSKKIIHFDHSEKNVLLPMMECEYFKVAKVDVEDRFEWVVNQSDWMKAPFITGTVTEGNGAVSVTTHEDETKKQMPLNKGSHFILTCNAKKICFTGEMEIVFSSIV